MQSVSFQNQGLHQSMCKQFIERGQKVTITVYIILLFVSRTSFPLKKNLCLIQTHTLSLYWKQKLQRAELSLLKELSAHSYIFTCLAKDGCCLNKLIGCGFNMYTGTLYLWCCVVFILRKHWPVRQSPSQKIIYHLRIQVN